jgi:hypothetical protein
MRPTVGRGDGDATKGDRMDKLSTGHKIGIGGALVLLVASFLPWYSVGAFGITVSVNGWGAEFLAWFGILVGLAAGVVLALKALDIQDIRLGGFAAEQMSVLLAAVSFVFIVLRFITESSNVSIGLFLGLVGAAAIAFGSFQAMKEAGMSVDDMKKQFSGGGGSSEGPTGSPGPSQP